MSDFIYVMCTFLDLAGILDVIQPLVGRGKMFPNWLASSCVSLGEIGFTNFFLSFFCSEIGTLAYRVLFILAYLLTLSPEVVELERVNWKRRMLAFKAKALYFAKCWLHY